MANGLTLPATITNGRTQPLNATVVMLILNAINNRIWKGTTAPTDPTVSPIWIKTDEDANMQLRVYVGSAWKIVMLADIEY